MHFKLLLSFSLKLSFACYDEDEDTGNYYTPCILPVIPRNFKGGIIFWERQDKNNNKN